MRIVILLVAAMMLGSCERPSASTAGTMGGMPAPPAGRVTLGQTLHFADGSTTYQGTGFLARSPKGAVVGVTSAHFLDREGPRLVSLELTGQKGAVVATCTRSLGMPGNEGVVSGNHVDLRMDYVLLWPEAAPDAQGLGLAVLAFDARTNVPEGERVWLPYDGGFGVRPERRIPGRVTASDTGACVVELDENVELMGHSGSPVVSLATGKVIGTLSRGGSLKGKATLILAPSHALLAALTHAENAGSKPPLRDNIGTK